MNTLRHKKNDQTRESKSERRTYEAEKQQFESQNLRERESSSGAVDSQSEKIVVVWEFFAKEHSFAVAMNETAELFKIVVCEDNKFLANNIATGSRTYFNYQGNEVK